MSKYIATVCFFVKSHQILLVEIEYPDGRRLWNGVGGKVDEGETPQEAVVREIGEETTLQVEFGDVREVEVVTEGDFELHVFLASRWQGAISAVDPTLKQFKWFDFKDIPYNSMHVGNDVWLPRVLGTSERPR